MITLSAIDGSEIKINPRKILRFRRTIADVDRYLGSTRIDWGLSDYVTQEASLVAAMVLQDGVEHIARLTMPGGSPVWFNASVAAGPLPVSPKDHARGAKAAVEIGNRIQYLAETPERVAAAIAAGGGEVLPFVRESVLTKFAGAVDRFLGGRRLRSGEVLEEWDPA